MQHTTINGYLSSTRKQNVNLLCNFCNVITSINSLFPSSHSCTDQQPGPACCCPLGLVRFQKFLFIKKLG